MRSLAQPTSSSICLTLILGLFAVSGAFAQPYNQICQGKIGQFPDAYHTGAVDMNGLVWMWGDNTYGQLGDNTVTNRTRPLQPVKGEYGGTTYLGDNTANPAIEVAGSSEHATTSGHTIALMKNGTVYAFGYGGNGQIGNNSLTNVSTPVLVRKGEYNGTTYLGDNTANPITDITAGAHTSLALATDGTVYAWGKNLNGELGNAGSTDMSTPVHVRKGEYNGTTYLGDVSTNKIIAIAGSEWESIALAQDGTVYTWGYGGYNALGINAIGDKSTPVRVYKGQYNGTTYLGDATTNKITQIATGGDHVGALAQDGTVYSWGWNGSSALGDGTATDRSTPVRTLKGQFAGTTYLGDVSTNKIATFSAGGHQSQALMQDGTLYAWGENTAGQLGDNTNTNRATPVRVRRGAYADTPAGTYLGDGSYNSAIQISSGEVTLYALMYNCAIYGWGNNANGQVGNNSVANVSTPARMLSSTVATDFGLPITLSSFEAKQVDQKVVISWETASEVNNYAMEVECDLPGAADWQRVGLPVAGYGTTNRPHQYQLEDVDIERYLHGFPVSIFYRLKSIALDGSTQYSQIREVTLSPVRYQARLEQNVPNPVNTTTLIRYTVASEGDVSLKLYDSRGRMVQSLIDEREVDAGSYEQPVSVGELPAGSYQYILRTGGEQFGRQMIVVK